MLGAHLHLGQEAIDEIDGGEENVVGEVVPDFEAAQDVRRSVTSSNRNFAILSMNENKFD